jgi:hypothetical protein
MNLMPLSVPLRGLLFFLLSCVNYDLGGRY